MPKSIQWKELYPLLLTAATWGHLWLTKHILFLCNNKIVVDPLLKVWHVPIIRRDGTATALVPMRS